jgi:hypothetical protein
MEWDVPETETALKKVIDDFANPSNSEEKHSQSLNSLIIGRIASVKRANYFITRHTSQKGYFAAVSSTHRGLLNFYRFFIKNSR